MPKTFPGFSATMPAFFRGLVKNNDRAWFAAHKEAFERDVRGPMLELVAQVNDALRTFAVEHVVEPPAKALYRIYRDTRFSKDKTPFKDHIGATFHRRGLPRNNSAGFYFGVSHAQVEVAGGMYMPGPDELAAVRAAMVRGPKEFLAVLADKRLARALGPVKGEQAKRPPKGWEAHAHSPAAEYLKFKQLYWYTVLPAKVALTAKLKGEVVSRFKAVAGAVDWLNGAILAARAEAAGEAAAAPKRPDPMW